MVTQKGKRGRGRGRSRGGGSRGRGKTPPAFSALLSNSALATGATNHNLHPPTLSPGNTKKKISKGEAGMLARRAVALAKSDGDLQAQQEATSAPAFGTDGNDAPPPKAVQKSKAAMKGDDQEAEDADEVAGEGESESEGESEEPAADQGRLVSEIQKILKDERSAIAGMLDEEAGELLNSELGGAMLAGELGVLDEEDQAELAAMKTADGEGEESEEEEKSEAYDNISDEDGMASGTLKQGGVGKTAEGEQEGTGDTDDADDTDDDDDDADDDDDDDDDADDDDDGDDGGVGSELERGDETTQPDGLAAELAQVLKDEHSTIAGMLDEEAGELLFSELRGAIGAGELGDLDQEDQAELAAMQVVDDEENDKEEDEENDEGADDSDGDEGGETNGNDDDDEEEEGEEANKKEQSPAEQTQKEVGAGESTSDSDSSDDNNDEEEETTSSLAAAAAASRAAKAAKAAIAFADDYDESFYGENEVRRRGEKRRKPADAADGDVSRLNEPNRRGAKRQVVAAGATEGKKAKFSSLEDQSYSLFMNQIPYAATKTDVEQFLSVCGCPASSMAIRMLFNGDNFKGTCFVDLPNADAFEAALALHQSNFDVAADSSARRAVNVRPVVQKRVLQEIAAVPKAKSEAIANLIDENVQAGKMLATDADDKVMRFLQAVPEDVAKLAVNDFCELELSNVKNRASFFMGLIRKRQTSGATNKDFAPGSHTKAGIAGYEKRQKYKAGGRGGARGRGGRGSSRGGGGRGRGRPIDRMKAGGRAGNRGRGRARGGTNHFGASKNPLFAQ